MFILKKLHIENFMSIECADFTFSDNQITQITGDNGSGKSSLFYAIAYTIFGYKTGETLNGYVRIGAECAIIHMEVSFNDIPLIYDIELSGNKSKSGTNRRKVTYKDKTYLNSDYPQFLKAYGLEDFESLMFMFQESKNIIDTKPSERANMLRKLFKFEFPEIVESLKEQQENTKIKVVEHKVLIDDLKNRQFNKLQLMRETIPSNLKKWENRISEIQDILDQIGDINENEVSNCDKDIKETQGLLSSIEASIHNDKDSLDKLTQQVSSIEETLQTLNIDDIQNSIAEYTRKIEKHEDDYSKQQELDIHLNEELKVLQYKEKELKNQLEISKTGICHACGQPIEKTHLIFLEEELNQVSSEITIKTKAVEELSFDKYDKIGKALKSELAYNEDLLKKINNESKVKESIIIRIHDLTNLISERQNTLNECHKKLDLLKNKKDNLNNIIKLLTEKNELIREKEELKTKLQIARDNSIKNAERKNANLKIELEEKARDNKLMKLNEELNSTSISLARIKQELDIFESKFPNFIVLQACKQLEDIINDIVQKVFPYCKVSLKLSKGGVNFYYTPECSEGEWISVTMASGAQKKILGLAYFIALARLNNVSCVFLDEIDASMTDINASAIYDFIAGLDYFPQIFFISHRDSAHEAVKAKNEDLITYHIENGIYTLM